MGVKFDRVLDAFDGPFERVRPCRIRHGRVTGAADGRRIPGEPPSERRVRRRQSVAEGGRGRLLAERSPHWRRSRTAPARCTCRRRPSTLAVLREGRGGSRASRSRELRAAPRDDALKLRPVRIGLWDRYGGSSPSGWTRWLFERFEFPFEVVYAQTLDAGNLASRYRRDRPAERSGARRAASDDGRRRRRLPAEYRGTTGVISRARARCRSLKQFVEDGGTLIAIGESTSIGAALGLPVTSALVETQRRRRIAAADARAVLRARIGPARARRQHDAARLRLRAGGGRVLRQQPGLPTRCATPGRECLGVSRGLRARRRFAAAGPGASVISRGGVAAVDAPLGRGRVLLFGPEITFRGAVARDVQVSVQRDLLRQGGADSVA